MGNFKVRPNHTILIGIEDVLCEVLSSLNAMNLVTQNYQKKWLFHEYLPLKWFLFWKSSSIITYSGEKYLSSRSSSLEEVLLPRSTYKKEIAAPDNQVFSKKSLCKSLSFQCNKFCSGNIAASIKSLFHGEWSSEIRWKKLGWPNWIAANFNIRKMHSTVERIDACEYSKK